MEITISISDRTAEIIQHKAEESGKNVSRVVEEVLEEKFLDETDAKDSQDAPPPRPFMRMQGMFSSGKTDTSERMHEILYSEDFDSAEGFNVKK